MKSLLFRTFPIFALLFPLTVALPAQTAVSALGRVVPSGGVFDIVAPGGDLVEAVLVREGDWVDAGAPLGRLRGRALAEARLAQVEAEDAAQQAALRGETETAAARLAAAETMLEIATSRLKRILEVKNESVVAPDKVEERRLAQAEATAQVAAARDAQARARAAADTARVAAQARRLEARTHVAERSLTAPHRVRVLKILTQPGAVTTHGALFRVADTGTMQVVAEIYEADALRVKPGQKAFVASPALPKKLAGTVAAVGVMIGRNALQSLDPNAGTPNRIVEAVITLPDSGPLDRLVFLPVDVTIEP